MSGEEPTPGDHPLDPVGAEEIGTVRAALVAAGELPDSAVVVHVQLLEPDKAALAAWEDDPAGATRPPRRLRCLVVPGPELTMVESTLTIALDGTASIDGRTVIEGMRPALLMGESFTAIIACKEHPEYLAGLARRGIHDPDLVQIDPWPAGSFGYEAEAGRRIARCISFLRERDGDNGYARPVEGLIVHVDLGRGEVIEVLDHGVVPMPRTHARYDAASVVESYGPMRTDLRPIEITQPDGPSFTVDGHQVRWQKWEVRVGFDPYEGLTLHQLRYRDGDRLRSVAHRLSVSEMVVPYGDPGETQGWKNAFDAGEWGLGRMCQSLTLGCDCLGEIHYFDAVMANEQGEPWVIGNAICMHEEDYGIGWKHVDLWSGSSEVRRSRRLVISSIATVGNYEYGFFWYLYLDGTIQLEVKLTGIMSPQAVEVGAGSPFGIEVAPGLVAPVHQHLFCVRLDLDVDGPDNRVEEWDVEVLDAGPDNPWANAFRPRSRVLERESQARRFTDAASSRSWRVVNPSVVNGVGQPVGYQLAPTMSTPRLLARPESSVARRAAFATHNLWATPFAPDELRAAGEFPNQHPGGDGLPAWTAADRSLVDVDVVLWYCFGITHVPRPEDWPVMPVEYTGFLLRPVGFFDRNPALDVAPSPGHCHD